jgi:hypothetical protein
MVLILTQNNGLGYLLGDFLANTPGHPDGILGTMAIQGFD